MNVAEKLNLPSHIVYKKKGRVPGTKIEHLVTVSEFVPKFKRLVAEGKTWEEIAIEFNLEVSSVKQKRMAYNKASEEAGYPLNLPAPAGTTGSRGAKRIDWSQWAEKVEAKLNNPAT